MSRKRRPLCGAGDRVWCGGTRGAAPAAAAGTSGAAPAAGRGCRGGARCDGDSHLERTSSVSR